MENSLPQDKQIAKSEQDRLEMIAGKIEINHSSFSGPLPHPSILAGYDEIVPGAADRIIRMVENQSQHRMELEKKVIASDITNSRIGLIFALVIGLFAFYLSYQMAKLNQPWLSGVIGFGYVVSLVSAFIYGSQNRRKEMDERKKEDY